MLTKVQETSQIRFKAYEQNQVIHLPVILEEVVKHNALVQIVNEIVEGIEMSQLEQYYSGIGCPAYHPKMLIKVWIYGFCSQVYTSRKLARKLHEDLCFIWLAGNQRPCFKTLSEFRGNRMQGMVDDIFKRVLVYLLEEGYIDLEDLYVDGSKWEANANKYKIIWRKNTERYKEAVLARVEQVLEEINVLQEQEDKRYGIRDFNEPMKSEQIRLVLNSEQLAEQIKEVNELVEEQVDKKKQRRLRTLRGQLEKEEEKLKKYEEQEKILGTRNSYSKTDEDATGLRMKDDTLKPGYNGQITTQTQFIVNPTIHDDGSDSPTLPSHVDKLEERVEGLVEEDWCPDLTADAGYGSEENYDLVEGKFNAYIKYPLWYQQVSGKLAKQKFRRENWPYDEEQDYFMCPGEKIFRFVEEREALTKNGYPRLLRIYECEKCEGCPMFEACRNDEAASDSKRRIHLSRKLDDHRDKAREKLASEKGKKKRSQRSVDVETPFGDIKHNMGHRRFILRGKSKVYIEFLLLCIAHNIRKVYCEKTGIWVDYYAQRASRRKEKSKKRA